MIESEPHLDKTTVNQIAEQVLEGHAVGVGLEAICTRCKAVLQERADVTVYAYRPAGEVVWSVARLYCAACNRTSVKYPSQGCEEVLTRARLAVTSDVATQSSFLTLIDVSVVDQSDRYEGCTP